MMAPRMNAAAGKIDLSILRAFRGVFGVEDDRNGLW